MSAAAESYDSDYYAWALHNAELLRQGRFREADIAHIVEELEGAGNSLRRELRSGLKRVLWYLLKSPFQRHRLETAWAAFEAMEWRSRLLQSRDQIQDLLAENPSLKPALGEVTLKAYPAAVRLALKETGLPRHTFPLDCPYTTAQILDDGYYPGGDLTTLLGEHS